MSQAAILLKILKPPNLASLETVAAGEAAAVVAVVVVESIVPDFDVEYQVVPDAVPIEKFAVGSGLRIFDEAERKVAEATVSAAAAEYDMKVKQAQASQIASALTIVVK